MPPKCKFTRQEIIHAALELTRKNGIDAVTARALGEQLGASSRPIFSLFKSMQEVQQEIIKASNALYQNYLKEDMQNGKYPPYKASGMAYIRFAKEERELFKLLFMRDRSHEVIPQNFSEVQPVINQLRENTGLSEQEANLFHLEMWVYVHGIAVMIATSYLNWEEEQISKVLTDGYQGLCARHCSRGKELEHEGSQN